MLNDIIALITAIDATLPDLPDCDNEHNFRDSLICDLASQYLTNYDNEPITLELLEQLNIDISR